MDIGNGNAITSTGTIVGSGTSTISWDYSPPSPLPSRCARDGHEMADEAEYVDGSVVGVCSTCGELIRGRRLPGGLGVAAMRAAMMRMLEGTGDLDEFALQLLNLATILELEESQLGEAKALLRTAQLMLLQRRGNSAA